MQLRPYQQKMSDDIDAAWHDGARNVLAVLPTGAGKTATFAHKLSVHKGASIAIAHRTELVSQMSLTLGKYGVAHRLIAPSTTIREIVTLHKQELGQSFHDAAAPCAVAGVDTLVRRDFGPWIEQVTLWVQDEGHHLLSENKWGKAVQRFPNARGLGVTATPLRADNKGLGRKTDGVFDALIVGPDMRALIEREYLTDYRVFAPKSDINLANVPLSAATGDFSAPALREAARKSRIVGDVVDSYLKIARGKLGVTFCVSVELAKETAARYREAGVPAECVSAHTPTLLRAELLRRFRARKLLQLVNVDLFGEGFDLPAIEVVSMARPTQSYGLYVQQFGRALRPMEDKTHALIIDHVGNVLRHGLPDAPRVWTLDRRERRARGKSDSETIRVCEACTGVYERILRVCPYCGHAHEPESRSAPEHVDGDLLELDPGVLARLRGQARSIDDPPMIPWGATAEIRGAILKRHRERREAQMHLRAQIAVWAGWQRSLGRDDHETYRRFYRDFGVDVATAQTLPAREAREVTARINQVLDVRKIKSYDMAS